MGQLRGQGMTDAGGIRGPGGELGVGRLVPDAPTQLPGTPATCPHHHDQIPRINWQSPGIQAGKSLLLVTKVTGVSWIQLQQSNKGNNKDNNDSHYDDNDGHYDEVDGDGTGAEDPWWGWRKTRGLNRMYAQSFGRVHDGGWQVWPDRGADTTTHRRFCPCLILLMQWHINVDHGSQVVNIQMQGSLLLCLVTKYICNF